MESFPACTRAARAVCGILCSIAFGSACAPVPQDELLERQTLGLDEQTLGELANAGANGACSTQPAAAFTDSVMWELRCLHPDQFVHILYPPRDTAADRTDFPLDVDNIDLGDAANGYMQRSAAVALYRAARRRPDATLVVNHAYRSAAQQYVLYRQWQLHTCGIPAAAVPGTSNHESGLALDVGHHADWREALEAEGFEWLGENDPVHFDYRGEGTMDVRRGGLKIMQQMWNLAHPDDLIDADGSFGPISAARFAQMPAQGLGESPICEPLFIEAALERSCPDRDPTCVMQLMCNYFGDEDACIELCERDPDCGLYDEGPL